MPYIPSNRDNFILMYTRCDCDYAKFVARLRRERGQNTFNQHGILNFLKTYNSKVRQENENEHSVYIKCCQFKYNILNFF